MNKMKPSQVRVGMAFGRLTVTRLYREEKPCPSKKRGFAIWSMADCKCACDGKIVTGIYVSSLVSGRTESCGCLHQEVITVHGQREHPLYNTIMHMNDRCKNPEHEYWEDYGGRGIGIEYRLWDRDVNPTGFVQAFIDWNDSLPKRKQWRPGLEIDRIDNDRGYSPANCKWSTKKRQARNRRNTVTRRFRGRETPITDIFDTGKVEGWILAEIGYGCFQRRINLGWTLEQACKTPVRVSLS